MKNLFFSSIQLFSVSILILSCLASTSYAADTKTISDGLTDALVLKEAGDIDGAISAIEKVISISNTVDSIKSGSGAQANGGDVYTRDYLQTLIAYLRVDEARYTVVVMRTAAVDKKTRGLFLEIAQELKSGEFSKDTASKINEMKLWISRELVTHSFCTPPKGYENVYSTTQEALYRYSKAWENLYLIVFEKTDQKDKLQAEALLSFQKGNELFNRAGSLMLAVSKK